MAVKRKVERPKSKKKLKELVHLFKFKKHNILLLAQKNILKNIEHLDRFFNIDFVITTTDSIVEDLNEQTYAIVIDDKESKGHIKNYVENLVKVLGKKHLPIFVLSRSKLSDTVVSRLYELGVHAVIDWPGEASVFTELFIESLKPHEKAQGSDKSDVKVANLIEAHMQMHEGTRTIGVKVINGIAFLEGSVPTLWEKRRAIDETSHIIGVKKAIGDDIKIKKTSTNTDTKIKTLIENYITSLDVQNTIKCHVVDRSVTLICSSLEEKMLLKVEKFAMKQKGILAVVKHIRNIPAYAAKNPRLDKKLEKSIINTFEGVKQVHVRIYGDTVELKGQVTLQVDKKLIEDYVVQKTHLTNVVNKIKLSKI